MAPSAVGDLSVTMFTPWQTRCGIRDYSLHLLTALNALPGIAETRIVEAPANAVRSNFGAALWHYAYDERRFAALGRAMNEMAVGKPADIAHIQHQYFFFGGVGPHKTHIRTLLNAVRLPLIMTVHEIAQPNGGAVQRRAIILANRLNFLHPAIRCLIVHTEADRQKLVQIGVSFEKIRVVRHGIPPALPLPDPAQAKIAWSLEGKRVLTLFGFLSNKKGHKMAIEALTLLPSDIVLLFAGGQHPDDHTSYVPELNAEISRRNLTDRIRITGYLAEEDIPRIMALTDAALAPFLESSGSGSLSNLFAYGRAIVASDIAPHRELTAESRDALCLFPSENPERLAETVLKVLKNPLERERLQEAARRYAARHTYLEMARETLDIYREFATD